MTDSEQTSPDFTHQDVGPDHYLLRLYVTGMTPRSLQALSTIKAICEQYLANRYDLEVIDIYQHPNLAKQDQVIAAPTLVKIQPAPQRRLIGNLSDQPRLLQARHRLGR